ncbi:MAG: ABC transporter substrate-binding protein, partial [Myxococcota bacterium]
IPARNAGELVIDAINAGTMPAPYSGKGIAGKPIRPVWVDEAGGASKQVASFRILVQRQGVDAVVGYISSGDCLAVAPVAETLGKLTVFFDCGTPRVFEQGTHKYLFRTGATALMDNVAAARYVLARRPQLKTISGINQNYAWGHDSWRDFVATAQKLKPEVKVGTSQLPKLYAGRYSAEISALMLDGAEMVHASLWGGDLEGFIQQAGARGLLDKKTALLTTGETTMFRIPDRIPEGTILGARGPHGVFAPDNALNRWFRKAYFERYKAWPTYPAYKMAQALLGLKAAADKAQQKQPKPSQADIIAAFEYLEFDTPSGPVKMAIGDGHQAVQEMVYGRFKQSDGQPTVVDVQRFSAECVNPPDGMTSEQWIAKGFPGAKCP